MKYGDGAQDLIQSEQAIYQWAKHFQGFVEKNFNGQCIILILENLIVKMFIRILPQITSITKKKQVS